MEKIGTYNDGLTDGMSPGARRLTKKEREGFSEDYIEGYEIGRSPLSRDEWLKRRGRIQ